MRFSSELRLAMQPGARLKALVRVFSYLLVTAQVEHLPGLPYEMDSEWGAPFDYCQDWHWR